MPDGALCSGQGVCCFTSETQSTSRRYCAMRLFSSAFYLPVIHCAALRGGQTRVIARAPTRAIGSSTRAITHASTRADGAAAGAAPDDAVSKFCIGTNAFFKSTIIEPVLDYVETRPAGSADTDFWSVVKAPPESPGIPRPVWLTICASAPTGLLWYGYYKFSVEEELFQDELARGERVTGCGGFGTLFPFVYQAPSGQRRCPLILARRHQLTNAAKRIGLRLAEVGSQVRHPARRPADAAWRPGWRDDPRRRSVLDLGLAADLPRRTRLGRGRMGPAPPPRRPVAVGRCRPHLLVPS